VIERQIERLAAAGIRLLLGSDTYCVFERDGFAAVVPRSPDRLNAPGAAGLLTERGLAPLIWRGGVPSFVVKDLETAATPEQVASLRTFSADLEAALRAC
jgi:hypothetical protein